MIIQVCCLESENMGKGTKNTDFLLHMNPYLEFPTLSCLPLGRNPFLLISTSGWTVNLHVDLKLIVSVPRCLRTLAHSKSTITQALCRQCHQDTPQTNHPFVWPRRQHYLFCPHDCSLHSPQCQNWKYWKRFSTKKKPWLNNQIMFSHLLHHVIDSPSTSSNVLKQRPPWWAFQVQRRWWGLVPIGIEPAIER